MIVYASGGKESFTGKRVAVSGSGNVAQYAALKVIELGGIVVSLSDSKGSIIASDEKGITEDEIAFIAQLKVDRKQLTEIANSENHKDRFKYIEGARPWTHVGKVDVALPSATQNEVSGEEAQALIEAGCKFIAEGSNMGCSLEAIELFENDRRSKKGDAIWYGPGEGFFILAYSRHISCILFFFLSFFFPPAPGRRVAFEEALLASDTSHKFPGAIHMQLSLTSPISPFLNCNRVRINGRVMTNPPLSVGKAANAGGVAVSGLEMAQNSQRTSWTSEEVDNKLKGIMESAFKAGLETAKQYIEPAEGEFPSLVAGSNIAGFCKVAEAMKAQGDWW